MFSVRLARPSTLNPKPRLPVIWFMAQVFQALSELPEIKTLYHINLGNRDTLGLPKPQKYVNK